MPLVQSLSAAQSAHSPSSVHAGCSVGQSALDKQVTHWPFRAQNLLSVQSRSLVHAPHSPAAVQEATLPP
ncbi:MAG TPA: hypothetical protein VHV51_00580 [Polyangiaceae bacterium]|nr:hypothetical protein [Polyangiaceae bacterium]